MTLIFSYANPVYVLQVGDRLVSTTSTNRRTGIATTQTHDSLANKAIIYFTSDAIVAISYTGLAYIMGRPTDTWLAGILDPGIGDDPDFMVRFSGSTKPPRLDAAIFGLANAIDRAMDMEPGARQVGGLRLQAVGWQWKRGRSLPMPIMRTIWHSGQSGSRAKLESLRKYWGWESGRDCLEAIGDLHHSPCRRAQGLFGGRLDMSAEPVENDLVTATREVSDLSGGTVGRQCISILIGRCDTTIRVRYLPDSTSRVDHRVFTPWVVAPGAGAMAPAVIDGQTPILSIAGRDIKFERSPSLKQFCGNSGSVDLQNRKPPP